MYESVCEILPTKEPPFIHVLKPEKCLQQNGAKFLFAKQIAVHTHLLFISCATRLGCHTTPVGKNVLYVRCDSKHSKKIFGFVSKVPNSTTQQTMMGTQQ